MRVPIRLSFLSLLAIAFGGITPVEAQTIHTCVTTGSACLDSVDSVDNKPLGNRVPLVLVHGWNPEAVPAPPLAAETWTKFVANYASTSNSALQTAVKLYSFSYNSNAVDIVSLCESFRDVIDKADGQDSTFNSRSFVIVAHSMGGLIARYAMRLSSRQGPHAGTRLGDRVLKLITLGTPHHGSPFANGPAMTNALTGLGDVASVYWSDIVKPWLSPQWYQPNRHDLLWDNYDGLFSAFPDEQNAFLTILNGSTLDDTNLHYS